MGRFRLAGRAGRLAIILSLLLLTVVVPVHVSALPKVDPNPGGVATDPSNDYLAILVGPDGRYNSGATGIITGSSYTISFAWPGAPWSAFTTVRIDGADTIIQNGTPVSGPTDVSPTMNETKWMVGDIEVTQQLSLVVGTSTGRADTGAYTYLLKNTGAAAHTVGLRVFIDTMLADHDDAPFRIPGTR